jgi:4-amino-4-deoxy-L-arabinose transferase-like glycosyltransferase
MLAARAPEGPASGAPERALVALVSLGTVAALLVFRGADDNRLTSWTWVFAAEPPLGLFGLVAAGVALALVGARLPAPRRPAAVLFGAACAAGACTWGVPEVIVDAARYFTQAKHVEVDGPARFLAEWGRSIPAWTDLPLVPLLDGLVLRASGESRLAVQVLGTLLFAGAVAATQRLGAALWDDEVGLTAGALLLAMPFLLAQVPLFLVDVPSMFFVVAALLAVVRAVQRGGAPRAGVAVLAVVLALASKYSTWLLLTAIPLVALAVPAPDRRRSLRTVAAIAVGAAAVGCAALVLRRDVLVAQLALLREYQAPGLARWGEAHASTFLFQIHPFVTAAALLSVATAIRRRDARWAIAAWPVLLLLALQVHRSRYWIPALPMLALLAALGLRVLRARETRAVAVGCAVATSLVVALHGYVPFLERTSASNLAAAGAWLDRIPAAAVEVLTPAPPGEDVNPAVAVPLLDLYTSKRLVAAGPPAAPPAAAALATSPLRFTWAYALPPWYEGEPGGADAVVVVSADPDALPTDARARLACFRRERVFAADEGVFGWRTSVAVYRRARDQALLNIPRFTAPRSSSSRSCFASSCARYERK